MGVYSNFFLVMLLPTVTSCMDMQNFEPYHSTYYPTELAKTVIKSRRITDALETPQQMLERVVDAVFSVEEKFQTKPQTVKELKQTFGGFLDEGLCMLSTSILTNAGRYAHKPLSACTAPPIDLRGDISTIKSVINQLHQDGMGTGLCLDVVEDPVAMLKRLNKIAIHSVKDGKGDRPVACMAILSVHHPKIQEFINAKNNVHIDEYNWKFNISVNLTDQFMKSLERDSMYQLNDGKKISPRTVMEQIATSAHSCGDPGVLFLDRLNRDNPTPGAGAYVSVAPCAEVGLAPGESCLFGYINIAKFFLRNSDSLENVDFKRLENVTRLMVRALDDALELSLDKYAYEEQCNIMKLKRKIGIGVCGLADFFVKSGISYCDEKARCLAQDIVAFINYTSKTESHNLAKIKGSFGAIELSSGCTYNDNPGFIERRLGNISTEHVSQAMWHDLAQKIRETRCLRNSSTVALAPTGNSSILLNTSPSIEPLFSVVIGDSLHPSLHDALFDCGITDQRILEKIVQAKRIGGYFDIPESICEIFKTSLEISAEHQLAMIEALQFVVDESISKTVNVSRTTTVSEVYDIFIEAYRKGLKGITVYRDSSRIYQPKELGGNDQ